MTLQDVLTHIQADPRIQKNLDYGEPRRGHAEGTVRAHVAELYENLQLLQSRRPLSEERVLKLKILIETHDSFKAESGRNLPILDPKSHSTLAARYLITLQKGMVGAFDQRLSDTNLALLDLSEMAQFHDFGLAAYLGRENKARVADVLSRINDLETFLLFCIIDSCTRSKGRLAIKWLIETAQNANVTEQDVLPGGVEDIP